MVTHRLHWPNGSHWFRRVDSYNPQRLSVDQNRIVYRNTAGSTSCLLLMSVPVQTLRLRPKTRDQPFRNPAPLWCWWFYCGFSFRMSCWAAASVYKYTFGHGASPSLRHLVVGNGTSRLTTYVWTVQTDSHLRLSGSTTRNNNEISCWQMEVFSSCLIVVVKEKTGMTAFTVQFLRDRDTQTLMRLRLKNK